MKQTRNNFSNIFEFILSWSSTAGYGVYFFFFKFFETVKGGFTR